MPVAATTLDTTAIVQKIQQSGQSSAIAVPDGTQAHRFEPIMDTAAQTAYMAGMLVNMSIQFFINGVAAHDKPLVYTLSSKDALGNLITDLAGNPVSPHVAFLHPFDRRINQPVMSLWIDVPGPYGPDLEAFAATLPPDPRAVPIVNCTTQVSFTSSLMANIGVRQCAAPSLAQMPAPLPAPVAVQVSLGT